MTFVVGVCDIRVELEQFYPPFEGVGDGTLADLDVVHLLKPDDEFLLRQLRVFLCCLQRAMRIVSVIVVCFAPNSGILVVGDVLEKYMVVSWGWCVWRCV